MPTTPFCICATCTHSQGFPTLEEVAAFLHTSIFEIPYTQYQKLSDGKCAFMPPVPIHIPYREHKDFTGERVIREPARTESRFPDVSPVGRCGQWTE